jgi:hypothetical protein
MHPLGDPRLLIVGKNARAGEITVAESVVCVVGPYKGVLPGSGKLALSIVRGRKPRRACTFAVTFAGKPCVTTSGWAGKATILSAVARAAGK